MQNPRVATVSQLSDFDEIVDVRSPAEYAEDHIPGAISAPVLDDEQRAEVGTLYTQVSPFAAKKHGAVLIARNIAHHLDNLFSDKPKQWKVLVYCWRGGQRSGAFVTWLRMIGWDAHQLAGGYKQFRHHVIDTLQTVVPQLKLRMVCGATGSAKTRVLEALARHGAQVLDLEDLAAHKGSVLGALPNRPQPTQKAFETGLYDRIRRFDPARTVYVEAESRKIGRVQVPDPLLDAMRAAPCIRIEAERDARLEFLVRDYAYLHDDIPCLRSNIERLRRLQSNETLARWHELAEKRDMPTLFGELIDLHYDPLYRRSQGGNFISLDEAPRFACTDLSPNGIDRLAREILAAHVKD